ncbi:MAG: HEPN domain-containing protein [Acidimicrobiales bacterium]
MPERAERLRREAWRWHHLAGEDLLLAENALAPGLPLRGACLWAQQAAEAAVRAVLVARDVDPPKSHDLVELVKRCHTGCRKMARNSGLRKQNPRWRCAANAFCDSLHSAHFDGTDATDLAALTQWSIAGRYPADMPDVTRWSFDRLFGVARDIVGLAARALEDMVGRDPFMNEDAGSDDK